MGEIATPSLVVVMTHDGELRVLQPRWNGALIAASIAISFLGAFTATQLMCHARMSAQLASVFFWSLLGSCIFGFCSIWSLHEVAMLACEFDVLIGIDPGLTILSAVFAVLFTFSGLSADMLWDRYKFQRQQAKQRKYRKLRRRPKEMATVTDEDDNEHGSTPLLGDGEHLDEEEGASEAPGRPSYAVSRTSSYNGRAVHSDMDDARDGFRETYSVSSGSVISKFTDTRVTARPAHEPGMPEMESSRLAAGYADDPSNTSNTSEFSWSRRQSTQSGSGSFGLTALGLIPRGAAGERRNPFLIISMTLYEGCTTKNISQGFVWSIAITSMHYLGVLGLKVPTGFVTFNTWLVLLSAIISWIVCCVGQILMAKMETHLPQQILFSLIAATGVAAMHFTGMAATTFHTRSTASEKRGYPPALANAVVGIAFVTCITANVLLAHAATVSRNKLAEIVWTRKELWRAIALKETAEAATRARSDFIASASHELRTPLHHLQGYSDLLAQEELTGEGKKLLNSIQRALKTLSHITNNVLDWSKYERNTVGSHQPVALDIRQACESIIVLLPNVDEEANVQLYVVVAPDIPATVFLDEDWIHRILMNLLSNALKFTKAGFILLSIERRGDRLQMNVQDTGCGLAPDFIPSMWEPFKQGEVRGSARGTGLGLSIIRQLLRRMNGTVEVESRYMHDASVAPGTSGTVFTVEVPLQSTGQLYDAPHGNGQDVAILAQAHERSTEGLFLACKTAGFETRVFHSIADVSRETSWKYVWTDLGFLQENSAQFSQLLKRKDLLILVPYDTSDSLGALEGILSAPNIVMLQKPIIMHTIDKRISAATQQKQRTTGPSRTLRFASDIKVLNDTNSIASSTATLVADKAMAMPPGSSANTPSKLASPATLHRRKRTIMLVEDNTVNQKLGQKMLTSLGYSVVIANDGQECIDLFLNNFSPVSGSLPPIIDGVLMDQSMPRKDGVTATAELRALEASGRLRGRIPPPPAIDEVGDEGPCCGKALAIVALTAVVNSEAKEQFRLAGANDFLPKPLTLKRLKETLELYITPVGEE